jgi:hypothetical protein
MKLRTIALIGAGAWAYSKGPKDPKQWPGFLAEQAALLREQGAEAVAAAKQANARRQQEIDREIAAAMGRDTPEG